MKSCYIIAANCETVSFKNGADDLVIAVDGGYNAALMSGITADVILGDFDSLGFLPCGKEVIALPTQKDDTDTVYAVKLGFERGYENFYIFGGLGGRTDHTVANIQTLNFIAQNGGRGYLVSEKEVLTVIKNSRIGFSDKARGTVSVFSLGGTAKGVNLTGLKYELKNAELKPDFPLGVSNEFKGANAAVSVENGSLLVVFNKSEYILID